MKRIVFIVLLVIIGCAQEAVEEIQKPEVKTMALTLTSSAFENNGIIPKKNTCDGDDKTPPLAISGVPDHTQSLAIIMDDPDAPGKVWDHWIVFNIPPDTTEITEGGEPEGVHGAGTSGNADYKGPCPPDAEHGYVFKLYALNTMLEIPEGATKEQVEQAMEGHILEQTELIGKYGPKGQ